MTHSTWLRIALATGFLCLSTAASAGLPAAFSEIDPIGVGDNTGRAIGGAPAGYDVSVRDGNNQPVPNSVVTLDFSSTNVRAYTAQDAGTTVNAAARTLTRIAALGSTNFAARTAGFTNANSVQVFADGVLLGNVKWRSTDVDGVDGHTGLTDLTYFSSRFLAAAVAPELNFDLSSSDVPGIADLSIFSFEFLSGAAGTYAW